MIRVFLIVLFCGAMACNAIAHNAKIATYTLRDTGMGWFIEMNFAQAAIDAQMLQRFDKESLSEMSEDDYKRHFLNYLTENFNLRVDGKRVELLSGGIRLGSHQTDVKYVLPDIPMQPQNMSIYLPMFEDIYNQTNLFRIYRGGETFTKFFLSADNDFSAHMEFTVEGIQAVEKVPTNQFATISGIGVLLIIVLFVSVLVINRLKNSKLSKA